MPHSVNDGKIGIDLLTVTSARNFGLGNTAGGEGASHWLYVLASSALNDGALVVIEPDYTVSAFRGDADPATMNAKRLGFAQTAYNSSQHGFVAIAGHNVKIRVQGAVASANAPLFTEASGEIAAATASGSAFQVFGVYLHASVSASGTTAVATTAAVSYPFLRRPA